MTRKHFILIANAFHGTKPLLESGVAYEQWLYDVQNMAAALSTANPRFDIEIFVKWCEKGSK